MTSLGFILRSNLVWRPRVVNFSVSAPGEFLEILKAVSINLGCRFPEFCIRYHNEKCSFIVGSFVGSDWCNHSTNNLYRVGCKKSVVILISLVHWVDFQKGVTQFKFMYHVLF